MINDISYLVYSQILLNLIRNDHHFFLHLRMDDIHLTTNNFFILKHYYMDSKPIVGMDLC
jgi:hypothetical protein